MYALGGVDFAVRPWSPTAALSRAGGDRLESEPRGVFNSLAVAYMATIAALALSAGADPEERSDLVPALLVAKGASAAMLLIQFIRTRRRGFAAGAAVDAVLLGVTGGLYAAARDSR